ncbi:MAG: CAP domain-containing protein [Bacteroidota bacterium]
MFFLFSLLFSLISINDSSDSKTICVSSEEEKLFHLINDYRAENKLNPIPFSKKLTLVAQSHAKDLVENYNFDRRGKCNPHSWSDKGAWSSCCYTSDHKKASCMWDKPKEISGYDNPGYEIAYYSSAGANAAEGLEGWQHSPSHNPLLVNTGIWNKVSWKAMGIGIYGEFAVVWFGQLDDDENTIQQCQ